MRIDNDTLNRLSGGIGPLNATDQAANANAASKASTPSAQTDQVTLSADARLLLKAATDATAGEPAIRMDVIERMRALLNEGKLGNDAARLADAIIDDVLKNT
jgi:flagellar biosynthesis anti-sigma factor FlgM